MHFTNLIDSFLKCVYYGFRLFVLILLDFGPSSSPESSETKYASGIMFFLKCFFMLFALLGRRGERCGVVSTMHAKQTNIHSHTLRQLPSAFSSPSAELNFSVCLNFCIFVFKQVNSA